MIEAYAVADVRAVEDLARAELPEDELMQRASRGLAEVVLARLADADGSDEGEPRVAVLAGRGTTGATRCGPPPTSRTAGSPSASSSSVAPRRRTARRTPPAPPRPRPVPSCSTRRRDPTTR